MILKFPVKASQKRNDKPHKNVKVGPKIFSPDSDSKNFENRSIFDKVITHTKMCHFFGPHCIPYMHIHTLPILGRCL